MNGKAVKIRQCPATVSGTKQPSVRHCIAKRMWEVERDTGTAKSGDRFSGNMGTLFRGGKDHVHSQPPVLSASVSVRTLPRHRCRSNGCCNRGCKSPNLRSELPSGNLY